MLPRKLFQSQESKCVNPVPPQPPEETNIVSPENFSVGETNAKQLMRKEQSTRNPNPVHA
jgi:hypothetical protein